MNVPNLDNIIQEAEEEASERTIITFTSDAVVFNGAGKIVDMYNHYKVSHEIRRP